MTIKTLPDELGLLAEIAEGNQMAFKKVYDTYFSRTCTFAFHVLHSKELAQEVVQEVMLRIWQMGNELLEVRDLEGYLKILAKRKAIDLLRRQIADRKTISVSQQNWQEGHVDTEEAIILNETRQILEAGINKLPAQQKLVYQLCHQQGMKYEEAARQLNISPATVHSHMKLALKFLRLHLKDHTDIAILLIIFKLF